ncbi:MAG: hypothetical protein QM796_05270 [Chthoniobacteraceae bacterium]
MADIRDGHCYYRSTPEGGWTYGYDGNGYLHTATGWKSQIYSQDEAGRPTGVALSDYYPLVRNNQSTVEVFGSVNPGATVTIGINGGTPSAVSVSGGRFDLTYTPGGGSWQT